MNPRFAIPVIWTLASALLVKLLASWSRLPQRVAVHFNAAMQPNGWSSKTTLGAAALLAVLGQAALATFLLLRVGSAAPAPVAFVLLAVNVVLVCTLWQVINYNAGMRMQPLWIFIPMIAVFAFIAVFLMTLMFGY